MRQLHTWFPRVQGNDFWKITKKKKPIPAVKIHISGNSFHHLREINWEWFRPNVRQKTAIHAWIHWALYVNDAQNIWAAVFINRGSEIRQSEIVFRPLSFLNCKIFNEQSESMYF